MIELLRLILHIVTSLFKPRAKLAAEILVLRQPLNVLRRQVSKRHDSAIPIAFCSFGSTVGSLPFSARLQFSGRRPSCAASDGVPIVLARAVTQAGWQAENLGRAAQSDRRD